MSPYNPVVAKITRRALLGRRRALLLVLLPLLLLLLVTLLQLADTDPDEWLGPVIGQLGLATMLPLAALIAGTSVLGSEIDDDSVIYLLSKPVPRHQIVVTKLVVAAGVTAVFVGVPLVVAAVIATGDLDELALGVAVGALVGSLVYNAIFVAISVLTRWAVAVSLLYVAIWEGILGSLFSGTRSLSVQQYTLSIADAIAASPALDPRLSLQVAVAMSVLVSGGFTILAVDRLGSFSLSGTTA